MIKLYSTNCAKCKVIETKLKQANVAFSVITDVDEVTAVGKAHGITSAPILQVEDKYYDFSAAVKYLKEIK
jgi:arsenate reductase-like glutaredoxin family protein